MSNIDSEIRKMLDLDLDCQKDPATFGKAWDQACLVESLLTQGASCGFTKPRRLVADVYNRAEGAAKALGKWCPKSC